MCFGDGGASRMAREQRSEEQARQARIRAGMGRIDQTFASFDEPFYADRAKAYVDYATPQIDRQADDARRQLIFALSRSGNLDSSAANRKNEELSRDVNEARVGAANEGQNTANRTRADVETARSNLVSMLNATGDADAASASALRQVQALSMPEGFSPLGQLFSNFLSGVSRIGSNAQNGYSGFFGPRTATPNPFGSDSARIVRG